MPKTTPRDRDQDGLFEDVDSDGVLTFDDAIALAFMDVPPMLRLAFDFDGDGDVDFEDSIELSFADTE